MFPWNLPKQNEGSRCHLLRGSQLEDPFEGNGRETAKYYYEPGEFETLLDIKVEMSNIQLIYKSGVQE